MRIVLISDTHTFHRRIQIPDGDLLIHAGDFMLSGGLDELAAVEDFNAWLGELPHPHKIVICGNHDRIFETHSDIARPLITNAENPPPPRDRCTTVGGLTIYGSPWTPRFPEGSSYWKFMKEREEMKEVWDKVPNAIDILVTHGPPRGVLDEVQLGHWAGDFLKGCV